jgi:hypothetical protein
VRHAARLTGMRALGVTVSKRSDSICRLVEPSMIQGPELLAADLLAHLPTSRHARAPPFTCPRKRMVMDFSCLCSAFP